MTAEEHGILLGEATCERELKRRIVKLEDWIRRAVVELNHEYDGAGYGVKALPPEMIEKGHALLEGKP